MNYRTRIFTCFVIFGLATRLFGQSVQQFANLGDFQLENGSVIYDCKIGYRTFGKLNSEKSNAIIYPTWFGGTSADIANLLGPGKLVNTDKFYVIAIDAFGNGVSSSPSNSQRQPEEKFPLFTIRDMVRAEHRVLMEKLGVMHLYGAIGGSMGSFQVFEWLATCPDFIDRAIPYVCSPRLTSFDLLELQTQAQIIESSKNAGMSEKEIQKTIGMFTTLFAHSPSYVVRETPLEQFPEMLASFDGEPSKVFTSANRLSQIRAMMAHDISKPFGGSMEKAADQIHAKVLMIVCATDHIVNPAPAIELSRKIGAELLVLESDYGHLSVGYEIEKCGKAIDAFLSK
ncbi:MAG: alpha/beta fold hydrolase [Candidatus Marinimicrobia bacterium]|nr:alpha/beta fold hydrolase [Candidatus Neomarinimicrobiota bacterium]